MINDRIISVLVSADITREFFSWKYQVAAGDDDLNIAEAALSGTVNSVGMFKPLRPAVRKLTEES